jgi:hypothetical protein
MSKSFTERLLPKLPTSDKFIDKFCRGLSGVGIVTGRKLVLDTRPGQGDYLRYLWYGISYITGRSWSSYNPVPLSHGELQKITWAWGGSQTRRRREQPRESRDL